MSRHLLVAFAEILLDKFHNLLAGVLVSTARAGVYDCLVEIGEHLEDAQHIEIVICTERLHLGNKGSLVGIRDSIGGGNTLDSVVAAAHRVVVVTPLEVGDIIIALDVADLELMDVSLHGHTVTTLEGVVGADIKYPVGDRACKRLVVTEIVAEEGSVGGGHKLDSLVVTHLLAGEHALGLGVEQVVARCRDQCHRGHGGHTQCFLYDVSKIIHFLEFVELLN